MDSRQFDRMVKALGSGVQRRHIIGILAGGLTAALSKQRATLADHKASHCAHEGEKVQPQKGCCTGLIEGTDDRCEPEPPPPTCTTPGGVCDPATGSGCGAGCTCNPDPITMGGSCG